MSPVQNRKCTRVVGAPTMGGTSISVGDKRLRCCGNSASAVVLLLSQALYSK